MRKKSRLNCEVIWKIWKKSKLNSEKIGKIWKKDKLNCQMIWMIWKKSKLISEKIWKIQKKSKLNSKNMEDFRVSHNYTQIDLLLLLSLLPPPPAEIFFILLPAILLLFPLYMYLYCFSELRRIILEYFFAREYASRDLTLRLFSRYTTVRTRTS